MGGFLNALGGKLAERWITLLALPGGLYLAAVLTATTLGQNHALDIRVLIRRVDGWANAPAATTVGGQVVLLGAVLAGAAGAGIVTQAIGRLVELWALAADWQSWPVFPRAVARRRVAVRRERWDEAYAEYRRLGQQAAQARAQGTRLDPRPRQHAYRAFSRISAQRPQQPTWSGDRVLDAVQRLRTDSGIDLARAWPTLWLVLTDAERAEITAARAALSHATALVGWAVLYAALGFSWWPALLVALALAATARAQIHTAADGYAQMIEAAARLHAAELALPAHAATAPAEPDA